MRSLAYLLIHSLKNSFLEVFRKPTKLILYVLVILVIVGLVVLSFFTRAEADDHFSFLWLKGAIFLLILIFVVSGVVKGLSSGDVIFDMNDVNLLFVSPIPSQSILLYGLTRMARMSFYASFFILFQSNTLSMNFGVPFSGVLLLLLGYMLAVNLMQIISLLIYSVTNGNPRRKMVVRVLSVLAFLPIAVCIIVQIIRTGAVLKGLEVATDSAIASWTPVTGWAAEGVVSLIGGDITRGLLFFGLMVVTGALLVLYIARSNPDYYEDVLVATETAFEKKRAASEGPVNVEGASARKVKVAKTGLGGLGAQSIYYKHLRESFRASRLGLWGLASFLMLAGAILFAVFMRGREDGMLTLLQVLMWMQVFFIGTGRGLKELYSHYIYMIPEPPLAKIVWSNLELGLKVFVEAFVIFAAFGLIIGAPLSVIALTILTYTAFALLLIGVNFLFLRWAGADVSAGILIMFYFIAVLIIMLPGLVIAIAVGTIVGAAVSWGQLVGLGILTVWEVAAALACFALSKGILHRCDMPVVKAKR